MTPFEFESLVSFEGCKTKSVFTFKQDLFESLVSFEGCKTMNEIYIAERGFESLVSFEGCKTFKIPKKYTKGLRVL